MSVDDRGSIHRVRDADMVPMVCVHCSRDILIGDDFYTYLRSPYWWCGYCWHRAASEAARE